MVSHDRVGQAQPGDEGRDLAEELLATANPNPERVGCPAPAVLKELATRTRRPDDDAYKHLGRCSPCYRAVRELQRQAARQVDRAPAGRRVTLRRALAAAAAVLLVVAAAWFFVQQSDSPAVVQSAQLDLRPYTTFRSEREGATIKPVALARGRLNLKIILPVGAQAGPYELHVFDRDLKPAATARGEARVENYLTTFETTVDLASVPPGEYQLALRHTGEEWRWFPARVE